MQLQQNIAHNFYNAKVEHSKTLSLSHKSSNKVFSNQTADCPTSDFVTTSNSMGVVTIVALVLLPPSSWCVCAIALV
jgi:hypothetical protein